MSVKYFFAPNSPLLRESGGQKKKQKRNNYEALCFWSKRKNKNEKQTETKSASSQN